MATCMYLHCPAPGLGLHYMKCMQASGRSQQDEHARAATSRSTEPNECGQHKLHIEDWVPQEGSSMPKETNIGTLTEKFNAALQLLQVILDKVSLQVGPC